MLKKLITLVTLATATAAFAGPFDLFITTLRKDFYFTKIEKSIELNHTVYVTAFGPIGRIFNKDAAATYNGNLNMISIEGSYLDNGMIKSAREIMGPNFDSSKIATIFHEMGHAELDTLIENERDLEDVMISTFYKTSLKAFYKKHFPGFNSHTLFHEHFGYYRSDLIDFISGEVNEVLTQNGFNRYQNRCFFAQGLKKKLAEGISLDEYQKLLSFKSTDEFYRLKINPQYIFVRGKDVDLNTAPKAMIMQTHLMFWSYHQAAYNFPISRLDLIKRMNKSNPYAKVLKECRTRQWLEFHRLDSKK